MITPSAKQTASLSFACGGIPITIRPSFWFVTLMMVVPFRRSPELIAVWVVVVLCSVIVHELGHAFVARAFGGTPRIELHAMGGTAYPDYKAPFAPWQTILFVLAGPAAGVAFGAAVYAVDAMTPASFDHEIVSTAIADLLWVNLGYGLLNFVPIVPLDGGHAMRAAIEHFRGKPSPEAAETVSLVVAAALTVVALVRQLHWLFVLLAWLGISHLISRWGGRRRDQAFDTEFDVEIAAINASIAAGELDTALQRAESMRGRVRSPRSKGQMLTALAEIHLLENRPALAVDAIERFSHGLHPDADLVVRVWTRIGQPWQAVRSLRRRLAGKQDPALITPYVTAMLAADDLEGAMRCALTEREALSRTGFTAVEARLFHAGHYEDAANVATAAFDRFANASDAYNVARAYARLDRLDDGMRWLDRAVSAGYCNAAHLDADEDLAPLKSRGDFIALRAAMQ